MFGRGSGRSLPHEATQRLTASWLTSRPAAASASARASAAASAVGSLESNRARSELMRRMLHDPRPAAKAHATHTLNRRPPPPRVHHRHHVDLGFALDPIDDQIGQSDHRKFARPGNPSNAPQHRKLPEHHRRLHDPGDHLIGDARIVLCNSVPDRKQVVTRLRCEVNVQARVRAAAVPPGSSHRGPAPAPIRARPWRATMRHAHAPGLHRSSPPCRQDRSSTSSRQHTLEPGYTKGYRTPFPTRTK